MLTADIDLENQAWTPIGLNSENAYTGTFDGDGYTIEGLYIDSEETYAGLFGVVGEGGTVKELTVDGSVANKGKFTGGVIGYNLGAVENCAFTGKVNGGGGTGDQSESEAGNYTGGVVGINHGTIKNCRNDGDVTGDDSNTGQRGHTGGVAGENAGAVADCCNTGAVTGIGNSSGGFTFAGGVVIDTPGMREMGAESADLSQTFGEIEDLAQHCRFRDCTHTNEPGCAVLAAVEQGRLDQRRLDSYRKLEHESSYDGLSSKEVEVKKAERMFGKVGGIKQARRFAKEHNQRKHGKFPGGEM